MQSFARGSAEGRACGTRASWADVEHNIQVRFCQPGRQWLGHPFHICATEPEWAAQTLVDDRFTDRYDIALQTLTEVPYGAWREFDPEDSMRFFALRLHEVGMIHSSPNQLLAEGTDWRFLNELKRELKA